MNDIKIPPGHVSYLPSHTGDGYNYGGGLIVTWGTVSINLGGVDPMRGTYPNESLARVLAAAPKMLEALYAIIYASDKCQGHRNCDHDMTGWELARAVIAQVESNGG